MKLSGASNLTSNPISIYLLSIALFPAVNVTLVAYIKICFGVFKTSFCYLLMTPWWCWEVCKMPPYIPAKMSWTLFFPFSTCCLFWTPEIATSKNLRHFAILPFIKLFHALQSCVNFFVIPFLCVKMDNESCSDSEIEVEVANDKATKSENIKNIQDACNNNSSSGSSNNAAPPTTTSPPTLVMGQQGPLGPTLLGPRPRYPPTFSPVGPVPSSNPHPLLRQASFK